MRQLDRIRGGSLAGCRRSIQHDPVAGGRIDRGEVPMRRCVVPCTRLGQTPLARRRRVGHPDAHGIFELLPPERARAARLGGQEGPRAMVDRPYHDYATSALRELNRDLTSSQAQLEDQREDLAKRADSDIDDLRQLEGLVSDLGHQLAATDRELAARQRETRAVAGSAHTAVTWRAAPVRTHNQWVAQVTPKPHCRAKSLPATARGVH